MRILIVDFSVACARTNGTACYEWNILHWLTIFKFYKGGSFTNVTTWM